MVIEMQRVVAENSCDGSWDGIMRPLADSQRGGSNVRPFQIHLKISDEATRVSLSAAGEPFSALTKCAPRLSAQDFGVAFMHSDDDAQFCGPVPAHNCRQLVNFHFVTRKRPREAEATIRTTNNDGSWTVVEGSVFEPIR